MEPGSHKTDGQNVDSVTDNEATNLYSKVGNNKKRRYSMDKEDDSDGERVSDDYFVHSLAF